MDDTTMNDTTRQLALVTGASSGIGLELARQCAQNGYDLVVASSSSAIEDVAAELQASTSAEVEALQVDLATYDGVEQVGMLLEKLGRPLDACLLNAGIGISGDFTTGTSLEDNLRLIELNVTSTVHLAKLVLPQMVAHGSGRVLITSSIAGVMPGPYEATYAASKAFVKSFGEALAHELRDTGVTVTVLMPGPTDTRFFERAGLQGTKLGQMDKDDPAEVARDGFRAMVAGEEHVVAGSMKNRLEVARARVVPAESMARRHGALTEPGSGDAS